MPKHIEDMIVPERRRSIRDIPIPEGRRNNHVPIAPNLIREKSIEPQRGRKKLWMAIGVSLLLIIFASLSLFSGATLSYIPKSSPIKFDNDIYTAQKTGEGLLFSVIKFSGDKGQDVSASGEQDVKRKASGTIIVYNTSNKEQKFRATTRFATPEGKTYQVSDAIKIPAKKIIGGIEKPGTLEVIVYAEFPGKEFNIGLTDFTLPGLKGTPLSSSIYARSKTSMSGGFVGVEKIINKEEESRAKTDLKKLLNDEVISEARAQVPEDFILIPSLTTVTFEDLPQSESLSKDSVTVNMRGNLQGVMFKRSDLSTKLAVKKVKLGSGELVDLDKLDSLNFSFTDTRQGDWSLLNEIKFSVTGETVAVWRTDEVALRADLVGKNKRDLDSILKNYQTVVSASAVVRPFWKTSFPTDSGQITIKKLSIN